MTPSWPRRCLDVISTACCCDAFCRWQRSTAQIDWAASNQTTLHSLIFQDRIFINLAFKTLNSTPVCEQLSAGNLTFRLCRNHFGMPVSITSFVGLNIGPYTVKQCYYSTLTAEQNQQPLTRGTSSPTHTHTQKQLTSAHKSVGVGLDWILYVTNKIFYSSLFSFG